MVPYAATDGGAGMRTDFVWKEDDDPHANRRKEMLAKYGKEIRQLYGADPWYVPPQAVAVTALQLALAYVSSTYLNWFQIFLLSYCVGAFCNQNLFLAVHELSHNLTFKSPLHNQLMGMFASLATCAPIFVPFRYYHRRHHSYMGHHKIDEDIPTQIEANLVTNVVGKFIWAFFQLEMYALRPMFESPKPMGIDDIVAWACAISFDVAVFLLLGGKGLGYLGLSSHWAGSIHPIAGHFLSEHYLDLVGEDDGHHQETYSYYGILNKITYNVGFHNEHHDFPQIPGSRLPQLRKIAPEFYDNLKSYDSWSHVVFKYIMSSKTGPYSRVKRM